MSKSIPASSIHLGMSADELSMRILGNDEASQAALMSSVELASGWHDDQLEQARTAYAGRASDPKSWQDVRAEYLSTFLGFRTQWKDCAR